MGTGIKIYIIVNFWKYIYNDYSGKDCLKIENDTPLKSNRVVRDLGQIKDSKSLLINIVRGIESELIWKTAVSKEDKSKGKTPLFDSNNRVIPITPTRGLY